MTTFSSFELSKHERISWIFGAGASATTPYKVPIQSKMLKKFFDANYPGRPGRKALIDDLKTTTKNICNEVLPGVKEDSSELILEEVFSAYEIILEERRSTRAERQKAEDALHTLREAIRLSTYVHGRGDARKWRPHDRKNEKSPYAELIEKLYAKGVPEGPKNAFVTFNYDICLDRCLINLRNEIDIDLDYGIVLANSRTVGAPQFSNPRQSKSTLLLRTHGGLNWLRCEACQSIFTTVNKHATVKETDTCWACGSSRLEFVFVHPSYIRKYDDPIIQLVWGRCQEELVLSDAWVFVGYSLPAADVHFRALIRHCLKKRDEKGLDTSIYIVGRKQSNGDHISDSLAKNYQSIFNGREKIWESTEGGFSDFVGCVS